MRSELKMTAVLDKIKAPINEINRREVFRHSFMGSPLCGTVNILSVGEKSLESNKSFVCIRNIGSGGIQFESHLNLPVREDMVLGIHTTILGQEVKLLGTIRRKKALDNGYLEYGFKFLVDKHEADVVNRIVNELSIKMRKSMNRITGCNMCSESTACHVNLAKTE
jgi:hypothetical protein